MHFIGTMDHWDPAVTDGFANDREVILFNNAGVSSSSGEVPTNCQDMGANAIAFIKALGLKKVDVLGFSLGGFVAQEITLQAPDLVRRLVLIHSGPRGGKDFASFTPEAQKILGAVYDEPDHLWLHAFFTTSEASEVDPGFGTIEADGSAGRSVVIDGADDEEIETEDRRGAEGEDRLGGTSGAIDGSGPGTAIRGPSQPDLRLEEAASGASGAGV